MSQHGEVVGFDAYLRKAIRDAGYTSPSQFARAVSLDPSVVLRWLNGSQRPTVASLERAAPALCKTISELVRAAYPDRVPDTSGDLVHQGGYGNALADEIARLLGPRSPISERERATLVQELDRLLQPYRRSQPSAAPGQARSA
jgi:transcriptional regulator with XRE-family HTH domain